MLNGKERYSIVVDDLERRIIVQALSDLKDKQKSEGKEYEFLDNLIIKACDAKMIKGRYCRASYSITEKMQFILTCPGS